MAVLSKQLDIEPSKAGVAISAALPTLLGSLSENSQNEEGASMLSKALDRDHDGSILDDVSGFITSGKLTDGEAILKHAFGSKLEEVEGSIESLTGLDKKKTAKILSTMAPIVMGAIGKVKKSKGLDPSSLHSLLSDETSSMQKEQSLGSRMFEKFVDKDKDGKVMDDLAKMGGNVLKSFLK